MISPKQVVYIFLFVLLGVLAQFLIHAVFEIVYIKLLLANYGVFGLGLEFTTWFTIHTVFAAAFLVFGVLVGFWQGVYWWKRIYEK